MAQGGRPGPRRGAVRAPPHASLRVMGSRRRAVRRHESTLQYSSVRHAGWKLVLAAFASASCVSASARSIRLYVASHWFISYRMVNVYACGCAEELECETEKDHGHDV